MKIEDFDYELPKGLIAQTPDKSRDHCRLMVLNRDKRSIGQDCSVKRQKQVRRLNFF